MPSRERRASSRMSSFVSPSVWRRTPTSSSPPHTKIRNLAVGGQRRGDGSDAPGIRHRSPATGWAHSHIGSQIFDVDGFELAAHRVIGLLHEIVDQFGVDKTAQISTVDLGGGLGISYLATDDPPPVAELAAKLSAIVSNESAAVGLPHRDWWSSPDVPSPDQAPSRCMRWAPLRTRREHFGPATLRQRRRRHE